VQDWRAHDLVIRAADCRAITEQVANDQPTPRIPKGFRGVG
jgi:hypothetical protein